MRSWHPLSKLTIGLGLAGLVLVWWLDQGPPVETRAASAVPFSVNGVAPEALAATRAPASVPPTLGMADRGTRPLPPVVAFDSMVDRPLFAPGRRPLDQEQEVASLELSEWPVAPAAGPTYPTVSFIGSIEENGRVRALLGDGFNVRGVAVGQVVDGWTVLDIEARRLVLGLADERLELTILE